MAQGPEARLRTKIVKKLKSYGGYWFVIHGGMYQAVGVSDILGVLHGRFFALEVKVPGKLHTLTERQSLFLKRVRQAGGKATVVTSVDEAMAFVFNTPALVD